MKQYNKYKDSGIKWIGEIPEEWKINSLKYLSNILNGSTPRSSVPDYWDGNISWVTTDDLGKLTKKYIEKTRRTISVDGLNSCGTNIAPKGSVIISCRAPIGHLGILAIDACSNQGCKTLVPTKINNKYLFYSLIVYRNDIESLGKGSTFKELSTVALKNYKVITPTINEQTKIANYLDHKTQQIDELIADKQKLIEHLKEERTATINQAVTKGLYLIDNEQLTIDNEIDNSQLSTVNYKDSGIEWLGEIPEHWEVTRMRYLCDIGTGGKDTENKEDNALYPFFVRSQTIERISSYSFDGEAILTAGDGVGVCKVWHYINGRFDYHQRVYRMSDFKNILGKYLFYYLKENFVKEIKKLSAKSTVDSLRRPMFQNFRISYGSLEEQKIIVDYIEQKQTEINDKISKAEQQIELLKEYKTALISEVVTGKVDVRDEVLV